MFIAARNGRQINFTYLCAHEQLKTFPIMEALLHRTTINKEILGYSDLR